PKFILVSLGIALLPLGWAGVQLTRSLDRSLRSATERLQQTLAQRAADTLQNRMDSVVDFLTFARGMISFSGKNVPVSTLETVMNNTPILTDLWVYDLAGKERAAVHRFGSSAGVAPKEWANAKRAIGQRGYFAYPVEGTRGGPPQLVGVVPLNDEALNTTGYLAARVSLVVLGETLRGLDLGVNGRAFLLDKNNGVLASSLSERDIKSRFRPPLAWSDPQWSRGEYVGYDGQKVFGAQALLPEHRWRVIFEQPSADALQMVAQARHGILVTLAAAAAFAVLLAGLLSGWVVRPLKMFVHVVRKMKGGEFDSLIDVRSRDEMGDIAQALREAQPELEKRVRDSLLGRMSRMIGHDLRTPVEALRNSLDAIVPHVESADETAVRHFKLSYRTLDWISDYVEDMLTVGRDRAPVARMASLNDLVRHVLERFQVTEGVSLVQQLRDPVPLVPIDEREARRAVANVIKNALEAVSESGTVTVSTHADEEGVFVRVKDTGPGLSEEKKRHLFEEFTTKESGTGLGLLVIKKVMDKHKGRVAIQSAVGQGTTVDLIFPRK
ncbi:MAG: sensor histidine kinase, partial [Elusimicrobia bacterium]|nr:sensor histidine kinase [Elusimicrobiota bacterium]